MYFDGILIFYFALIAANLAWASVLGWRWFAMPAFAGQVYEANVSQGLLSMAIPKDDYVASYLRAERPRFALYRCATALTCLLSLPVLVALFSDWSDALNDWSQTNTIGVGQFQLTGILGDFVMFVAIMATYVLVLLAVTALYYRQPAPSLRSEVKRLEAQYR